MKNEDILKMIDSNPMEIRDPHYTFEGIPVPRVTEILSFIDMADLLGWANYMGLVKHKRYADIMTEASNIGTAAHSNIEKFFSEDQKDKVDKDNISFQAFMVWWNKLNMNHKVSILGQEEKLVCPYFGGTYDMLVSIDDKVYLIDFKTSNHVGYKYFLQLAAYRYMLLLSKDETTLTPVNTTSNSSASTKTLTTESFNPFGDIIYKSSTATTAAGSNIPSGVTWTQSALNLAYSFNTTNTLVAQKSVYIVAVPQSDGKAKLYDTTGTTTITQTLPTTEDGLIYIYLGQAYSTTNIFLLNNHPIYQFKDGQIRLYTNSSAVDQTIDSGTSASTNAVATQAVYNTIKNTELVWTNAYNTLSGVVSSHSSSYVTSMGGYTKPSTTSAISTSDTLNQAVGKLECALGGIRLQSISQSDYDALVIKDPNTLYIITS